MARVAGIAWKGLLVAGVVTYQVLVHLRVTSAFDPALNAFLVVPMLAVACWVLLRSPLRVLWMCLLGVASGLAFLLGQSSAALYGVPHATAYLFLFWLFGRTLARGREPFVTRLARQARGGVLPPAMHAYTRRLTIVWCVFFAAQVAISALLLRFGTMEAWSLFINVLNLPLLGLMFAADYAVRAIRYGDSPRSIANAIRAYAKERASSLLPR